MSKSTIAIILAGGMGIRMRSTIPKQFAVVGNMPILAHTIEAFNQSPQINKIIIVAPLLYIEKVNNIVEDYNFKKVEMVITGGKERYLSTYSALQYCEKEDEESKVLIHDGVRPLVSQDLIHSVLQALDYHNAVTPAIPTTDSILVKNSDNFISDIPQREKLMSIQTPQGFRLKTIRKAYATMNHVSKIQPTDDCGVVRHYLPEEKIVIVDGHDHNIKVTHPYDVTLVEQLLSPLS